MRWTGSRAFALAAVVGAAGVALGYFFGHKRLKVHLSNIPVTLDEEHKYCPPFVPAVASMMANAAVRGYQTVAMRTLGQGELMFSPQWAGSYMTTFYLSTVHMFVQWYRWRHADSVPIPTKMGDTTSFEIGHLVTPDTDIDDTLYLVPEKYVPRFIWNSLFLPVFNCYVTSIRRFEFRDELNESGKNSWETLLPRGKYKRKKDWVMTFYQPYHMLGGLPVYPPTENDFASMFWKHDTWDDALEKAIAFDLIGVHRVHPTDREFAGEKMAFVLPMNEMAKVDIRPNFGRYGADMYFNAEGMPVVIETPDGRQVQRGDKDWAYWKFVWRSTLLNSITLVDHLHLSHFRAGNILARTSRKTLPPEHHLRRFFSVFTFSTIYINHHAMHTLIGSDHALHRSTPFKEFSSLSTLVPQQMPSLKVWHQRMLNDSIYQALPAKIRAAPYYSDGKLLAVAVKNLMHSFLDVYREESCNKDGILIDAAAMQFRNALIAADIEAGYKESVQGDIRCSVLREELLSFLWTVTGWHRHVGRVGDYYNDPDLVGFSWKELSNISSIIKKRNDKRTVKNSHSDPDEVEISIAV